MPIDTVKVPFHGSPPKGGPHILIVGEAPGYEEVMKKIPFVGTSGWELDKMLGEAGIARVGCRVGNVIPYRTWRKNPKTGKIEDHVGEAFPSKAAGKLANSPIVAGIYVDPVVVEGLGDLRRELVERPPALVICVGSVALWALTGLGKAGGGIGGITSWRGSMLTMEKSPIPDIDKSIRVLPVVHPAAILRDWTQRPAAVQDLKRAARHWREPQWPVRDVKFHIKPTADEAIAFLRALRAAKRPFACDIETIGRNTAIVGVGNSMVEAMAIPLMTRHTPDGCYFTADEETAVIDELRLLAEDPECGIIGQNFHYDAQYFLRQLGIFPHVVDDTMWLQHVLFPGTTKSLDYISSLYCRVYKYWKDDLKDYKRLPKDESKFRTYNCQDIVNTYEVWTVLRPLVDRFRLADQYAFQMSLFVPVLWMMVTGVRVDRERRKVLRAKVEVRLRELAHLLESVVGHYVGVAKPTKITAKWHSSPAQIKTLFYSECGIKPILDLKTGRPTTNDEALEKIAQRHPVLRLVCDWLIEASSLRTFLSNFLSSSPDPDGRERCSYNVAGTETFRFSSSENAFGSGRNLQNIPREDTNPEYNIRETYVPDDGEVIVDFDLSSADLRVVIKESGAKKVQAILDRGDDVYGTFASKMDGSPYVGKKHPQRQKMKNVTHAVDYVGGDRTISKTYGLPEQEVAGVRRWYFSENPEIPAWHTRIDQQLRSTRRVANKYGYVRTYFERIDTVLSAACAWIGQSTVGITINHGLMNVWRRYPWAKPLLQVHDSVVFSLPRTHSTPAHLDAIREALLIPIPYPNQSPLVIPVGMKSSPLSWGHTK